MTWDEYYEGFYDWSDSTRANRISALTDFGSSDEIAEIAQELFDDKLAQRLIKKALAYGIRFRAEEIIDLSLYMDKTTMSALVDSAIDTFNKKQLEEIYMTVYDDVFSRASKKAGVDIFADDEIDDDFIFIEEKPRKVGFFTALFSLFSSSDNTNHTNTVSSHRNNGKCNGDCANCPSHYGYRYGRWYYGHHHNYGCEFGGNKGL